MAGWSQLDPSLIHAECRAIIHPWTKSCLLNFASAYLRCIGGSSIFFGMQYPIGFLSSYLRKDGKPKKSAKEYFKMFLTSVLIYGPIQCSGPIVMNCFFRQLIGRYTRITMGYLPSALCSVTILLQEKATRLFYITFWSNCAMSFAWNMLKESGTFKLTMFRKTGAFIILSSLISGLMKKLEKNRREYCFQWFFNPHCSKSEDDASKCYHNGTCLRHIYSETTKYLLPGLGLALTKLMFKYGKKPNEVVNAFRSKEFYAPIIFFALYSFLYQSVRCCLCRKTGKSTVLDNLIAGASAGAAIVFQPSTTLFNTAPITLVQILTRLAQNKNWIPTIPNLDVICYFFVGGIIVDAALLNQDHCPAIAKSVLNTATLGRLNDTAERLRMYYSSTK